MLLYIKSSLIKALKELMETIVPLCFLCQNVQPLHADNPCTSAPTLCIEPFDLSEITLPSMRTFANHLFLPSNRISPGFISPFSNKKPNGILGSNFFDCKISKFSIFSGVVKFILFF